MSPNTFIICLTILLCVILLDHLFVSYLRLQAMRFIYGKVTRPLQVKFKRLSVYATTPRVTYQGEDAAADLFAAEQIVIPARGRATVDIGLAMELPRGYCGVLVSRSGLALKEGIEVGAGLIDNGYRDGFKVLLHNHTDIDFMVRLKDRIAQLKLERYAEDLEFVEVEALSPSRRSTKGWGSSGLSGNTSSSDLP